MSFDQQLQYVLSQPSISYDEVKQLISHGANPNTRNNQGNNYLHIAILSNWPATEIIKAIQLGIDVNHTDSLQRTAFSHYLSKNWLDHQVVRALIRAGANCNATHHGETYLHIAIRNQWPANIIIDAVKLGVDITQENGAGYTPLQLYLASANNESAVVKALTPSYDYEASFSFDYSWILKQPNQGSLICDLLIMNQVNMENIAYLAKSPKAKEQVIAHIKTLPYSTQKAIVDEALKANTQLADFFAVQRGWFKTSKTRGTLAELVQLQLRLEKMGVKPSQLDRSFTPPRPKMQTTKPAYTHYPDISQFDFPLAAVPTPYFFEPSAPPAENLYPFLGELGTNTFRHPPVKPPEVIYYPPLFSPVNTTRAKQEEEHRLRGHVFS